MGSAKVSHDPPSQRTFVDAATVGGALAGKKANYCLGPNPAAGQNCPHFSIFVVTGGPLSVCLICVLASTPAISGGFTRSTSSAATLLELRPRGPIGK